jgi:putative FmdB family regulatory protein
MPLYEYRCKECNKSFEALQKIESEPLKECLYCRGSVEKLISLSSFQFKGSGWYVTDYKNKVSKTDKGAEKETSSTNNASIGKDKNATLK